VKIREEPAPQNSVPSDGTRVAGRRVDPNAEIRTDGAPRGTGAYSQAIRAGDFVFISGQGPLDPATLEVQGDTVEEQTEHTLRNLAAVAAAAGGGLADVVKVSAFLSSIDLFPAFNATYERIFATEPRPARTTAGAELRDILVEIDAVLYLPNG
jgi:2-iminobutanoate/2-iminopropanoate deaminase